MTATADNGWLLQVERRINASPETVWQVMTERMEEWWCPKPWRVEIIEQDWRAGGRAAMVMRGPDGEEMPQEGVFLEVVPGTRFVTTDAYSVGWIPQEPFMTGFWEITPDGDGTLYRAGARHWKEETMRNHEAMGFTEGWGVCADQLAALCEGRAF
jgi:uncharacterized protein YndB with AHSA1/START domain